MAAKELSATALETANAKPSGAREIACCAPRCENWTCKIQHGGVYHSRREVSAAHALSLAAAVWFSLVTWLMVRTKKHLVLRRRPGCDEPDARYLRRHTAPVAALVESRDR